MPKHAASNATQCHEMGTSFEANLVKYDGRKQCELWRCKQHDNVQEGRAAEAEGIYYVFIIFFTCIIYFSTTSRLELRLKMVAISIDTKMRKKRCLAYST